MPSSKELLKALDGGAFDALFARLYGPGSLPYQRKRYGGAVKAFVDCFGDRADLRLFSAPGRTEIGGNHTDHNHGRVLAASVNLDVIAVAAPCSGGRVRVQSKGYPMDVVELEELSVKPEERNRSAALVRADSGKKGLLSADLTLTLPLMSSKAPASPLPPRSRFCSVPFSVISTTAGPYRPWRWPKRLNSRKTRISASRAA